MSTGFDQCFPETEIIAFCGGNMKKIVSSILYVLFFGFAITLVTACIMLIANSAGRTESNLNNIEAVILSGSTDESDGGYEPIDAEVLDKPASHYQLISINYGYAALKDEKKENLYNRIAEGIYSVTNEPDENGRYRTSRIKVKNRHLSEFDIRKVVNAFISDNPEIFWIENLFGYAYDEDDTIVEFYSVLSSDDCEAYIERFNKRIDLILTGLEPGMTEYQREKYLHDKLLRGCVYKAGVATASDGWEYFSSYGAIVSGEAVCEGYAKAMQILLTRAGIPCSTVRGDADGVAHMWNVVELAGEWYHLDPTWNDNDKDGNINYEYFNITTDAILKNHTISDSIDMIIETENSESIDPMSRYNFFVPMCTAKDMNYYYAEGVMINTFDSSIDKALISAIIEKANKSEVYIPIRFGTELSYSEYLNKLFYESPYEFYYCIENANTMLDVDHRVSKDSVSVLKNETTLTLRVKISFENENRA